MPRRKPRLPTLETSGLPDFRGDDLPAILRPLKMQAGLRGVPFVQEDQPQIVVGLWIVADVQGRPQCLLRLGHASTFAEHLAQVAIGIRELWRQLNGFSV